jgi:hypothetical protein
MPISSPLSCCTAFDFDSAKTLLPYTADGRSAHLLADGAPVQRSNYTHALKRAHMRARRPSTNPRARETPHAPSARPQRGHLPAHAHRDVPSRFRGIHCVWHTHTHSLACADRSPHGAARTNEAQLTAAALCAQAALACPSSPPPGRLLPPPPFAPAARGGPPSRLGRCSPPALPTARRPEPPCTPDRAAAVLEDIETPPPNPSAQPLRPARPSEARFDPLPADHWRLAWPGVGGPYRGDDPTVPSPPTCCAAPAGAPAGWDDGGGGAPAPAPAPDLTCRERLSPGDASPDWRFERSPAFGWGRAQLPDGGLGLPASPG